MDNEETSDTVLMGVLDSDRWFSRGVMLFSTILVPVLSYIAWLYIRYYFFLNHTAQVTDVETMNDERRTTIHDTASRIIADHGLTGALDTSEISWESVREGYETLSESEQVTLDTLHQRLERTSPTLVELTIDADEDIDFAPGQFLDLRYNGTRRAYSIASSPNDDDIELCINRVPDGRLTENLLSTVQEGDEVAIWGPRGKFVLDEDSEKDLVFLATGTGVAPFRSMIRYLYQEGLGPDRDVWLFLGTRWEDDLPYHAEFEELDRRHDGFHYVPTLSRESIVSHWDGETNYVQETFMKYLDSDVTSGTLRNRGNPVLNYLFNDLNPWKSNSEVSTFLDKEPRTDAPATIDPKNIQVYVCGVDAAVSTLKNATTSVGVPQSDVYSEGYG